LNLTRRLIHMRSLINRALDRCLPPAHVHPRTIHRAMRYSVFSGGKRIRPILLIESCRACGGTAAQAMPAACAIELVHTYSLIHDDLPAMDDDDVRRGKPTLHKAYGEANAILAGDALLTLAFGLIAGDRRRSRPRSSLDAAKELAHASGTFGMVGGQAADLEWAGKKKDKKVLEYINLRKTACLFEASCALGAISALAPGKKVNALARFGRFVGLSFQIIDDIIDGGDYVKVCGLAQAHCDAHNLVERADESVRIFGKKADILCAIADHSVNRTA